ncbi:PEP-CTERM system TPR-repeat protein PrsT [Aliiglaciecola sp. 2_MG-2023]|uniref:XrtA/PEP-CTERM system TPR-repeat protein PrsT n=1 Tax=unclassified Aliiglaciecola TaxID=2593648 RepID=UPI0026E2F2EF|nr:MULTISPECIES: XrtA/PEP-CTERM system TPR-repeat protein PrsT [unclassified Aliiglaciecola]MDO6709997.1 PEP-CTERM system TPR-repeat protein PrsT [Aliiglaciecola sp. 2_MG-2023]MDO6751145.1 PEP-CTERM system TPR-repeat protein PrsT [Aliiglaciecola sp. 1_MG-2023]
MLKTIQQIWIILIVFTGIIACTPATIEERVESAERYISEGDRNAAIIELKNAISTDFTAAQPRLLLGKLYIEIGDLPSALKELNKALELGSKESEVLPLLSKVYYHMEEFESATDIFNRYIVSSDETASSLALFAIVASRRDNITEDQVSISAPNVTLTPSDKKIAEAAILIESVEFNRALQILQNVQTNDKKPLVLSLIGLAAFYSENYQLAIDALTEGYELLPIINSSSYLLANSYLKLEDYEQANIQVDKILKVSPDNGAANVLKAQAVYGLENYEEAVLFAEKAIQGGATTVTSRSIAGISHYFIGQEERAYTHLNALYTLNRLPKPLFKLLAELQIKLGYSEQAKNLLMGIQGSSEQDSETLTMVGLELARAGDFESASSLINKASKANPENTDIKLKKAIIDFAVSPEESSVGFEEIISADPSMDIAWVYLVMSHLKQNDIEGAISAAQEWQKTEKAEGLTLEGVIYEQTGDVEAAEQFYKQALQIDDKQNGASYFLARLYEQSGRDAEAFNLSKSALNKVDNKNRLLIVFLRSSVNTKKHTDSVQFLKELYDNSDDDINLFVAYAIALRMAGEVQQSADLLSSKIDLLNGLGFVTLGDSYIDLRQPKNALSTFAKWREQLPNEPGGYLRAIGIMMANGDILNATALTETAKTRFPNQIRFDYLYLEQMIFAKRFSEAKDQIAQLKAKGENTLTLLISEGDLAFYREDFEQAIELRTPVFERLKNFNTMYKLAQALAKMNRNQEALALINNSGLDIDYTVSQRFKLASLFTEIKAFDKAEQEYLKLLDFNPENIIWLNNLAVNQMKLAKLDDAKEIAEKARDLIGQSDKFFEPYILATLGRIDFLLGDHDSSFENLKVAHEALEKVNEITLDYMETLLALNYFDKFNELSSKLVKLTPMERERLATLKSRMGN